MGRNSLQAVVGSTGGVLVWSYWDSEAGRQVVVPASAGGKAGVRGTWVGVGAGVENASWGLSLVDAVGNYFLELAGGSH